MKKKLQQIIMVVLVTLTLSSCTKDEIAVPHGYVNESFFVRHEGADLYTTARGNNSTNSIIINIHGGPAQGAQLIALTRPVVYEELEKLGIVVYYDQRGIGLSTGHFSESTINLPQFTDDLQNVIEVCKYKYGDEKKIFLLSRSWGGLLAAEYLLNQSRQDGIHGWINIAGAYDLPKITTYGKNNLLNIANEQIGLNKSTEEWNKIKNYAINYDSTNLSWDNLNQLWSKGVEGMELLTNDGMIIENTSTSGLSSDEVGGSTAYSSFEVTQNDWQEIPETIMKPLLTYSPEMDNISIPTYFIYGKYDLIVPADLAQFGFENLSTPETDKYLQVYPNQAHFPMGNFEQFVSDVKAFIQKYE